MHPLRLLCHSPQQKIKEMSQSESTDSEAAEIPSTPVGIVEKNNMELWMFLFLLVATLLSIMFLIIEIIVFFFPDLVTSNHACSSSGGAPQGSGKCTATITRPRLTQPAFDSYAAWLTRIRTTKLPPPPPPHRAPPQATPLS